MGHSKRKKVLPVIFIHTALLLFFSFITINTSTATVKKIPTSIEIIPRGLTLGVSPSFLDFGTAARGDVKRGNNLTLFVESTEVDFNLTMKGTDLTGIGVITANAVEYKLSSDNWKKISSTEQTILSGPSSPQERQYLLMFRVNVPSDASLGVHTGMLTISLNTL